MFYSLLRIGEIRSADNKEPLDFEKLNIEENEENNLGIVVFDNTKHTVTVEVKRLGTDDEETYAFIGDAKANKPQNSITTRRLDYLLGFYRPTKSKKQVKKEEKKFPANKFAIRQVSERLNGTKSGALLSSILNWYKPEQYKGGEYDWGCSLYTVKVIDREGETMIAQEPDYRGALAAAGDTVNGVCHFCGQSKVLKNPDYPNGTILKIFITDKKGFLPSLAESSAAIAHSVCPECKRKLVTGDKYVERKLRAAVGDVGIYLVPEMPNNTTEDFLKIFDPDMNGWIIKQLGEIYSGERVAEDLSKEIGANAMLTLVIGDPQQAKFRIRRVIPEVRYLRLIDIVKTFRRAEQVVIASGEKISFKELYAALPVDKVKRGSDPKYFLEFFESMLLGNSLDSNYVYSTFLKSLRCLRYGTCVNWLTGKYTIENLSMIQETLIYAMGQLGIMSISSAEQQRSDQSSYAESLGIKGGLKGLFLLGALTAYVGKEQYNKGDKKKAILDRIDFEGMDVSDIKIFSNRLVESLKDYRQLNASTESLLAEANELITTGQNLLNDPQANVFYLIFGYSYQTRQFIIHGEKEQIAEADQTV